MDWVKLIDHSISYIEKHITDDISVEDVARHIGISSFYYQKGFSMLCGFSVSEYIRNRRLALAANELIATNNSIIQIALNYGYDSPDSFTKAFTRFHGCTPTAARKDNALIKSFAPLKIKFLLQGGYTMDYKIEKKPAFTVIANPKSFDYETAKTKIPEFWDEHYDSGKGNIICGEFGICLDDNPQSGSFNYLIADSYHGQPVPDGFILYDIPSFDWAVFPCRGALPKALQDTTNKIFSEWLPANNEFEFAANITVEMYDDIKKYEKGLQDDKYYTEIWVPVKKK